MIRFFEILIHFRTWIWLYISVGPWFGLQNVHIQQSFYWFSVRFGREFWARKTSFKYWMESNYHMTYGCMYFGLCYRNAAQTNSRILFLYFQSEMDELSIHICIMFIQNILKFILNFENNLHSHTQRTQADDWVSDVMVNEYSCMEYSCWFGLIKKNWPLKCLFTK